jgi:hypothetical protein
MAYSSDIICDRIYSSDMSLLTGPIAVTYDIAYSSDTCDIAYSSDMSLVTEPIAVTCH